MNLNDPKYKNTLKYPHKPERPKIDPWATSGAEVDVIKARHEAAMCQYEIDIAAWQVEDRRIYNDFRQDALEDVGLGDHVKKNRAWDFAWDRGHANGFGEVYYWLEEIAGILKD